MATTVWRTSEDQAAFAAGKKAATEGKERIPPAHYQTYNERAAFNDGWDTIVRDRKKRPRPKTGDR